MDNRKREHQPATTDCKYKYLLRAAYIGGTFQHEMTENEFLKIVAARAFIQEYMRFEETYLQLLFSFESYESFTLTSALNYYLFPQIDYEYMGDLRLKANVQVLGFLNSLTSLKDQFPKFKQSRTGDIHSKFGRLWADKKATSIAFRFCERLRNYAQHQTQPVDLVTLGGKWDEARLYLEQHLSVFVTTNEVCINRQIKAAERDEYTSFFGAKCDVSLILREALAAVGEIVKVVRDELKENFSDSMLTYENQLELVHNKVGPIPVEIVKSYNNNAIESHSIFSEFSDRAKRLRKTHAMANNHQHYISNRARGHSGGA